MKSYFKAYTFLFAALLIGLQSCKQTSDEAIISGKVENHTDGTIFLKTRQDGKFITLDSISLDNGSFTLKAISDPAELFFLQVDSLPVYFQLLAQPGKITLSLNTENPSLMQVQGSEVHNVWDRYKKEMEVFDVRIKEIQQKAIEDAIAQDATQKEAMEAEIESIYQEQLEKGIAFVLENSNSPASVYIAMRFLSYQLEPAQMETIINVFPANLHQMKYYTDLMGRYEILKTVAVGQPAPVFSQADTTGTMVSLEDLKGKYVLVDFWASWCSYCRKANSHMVEMYNKYGQYDFVIMGVSLDSKRENWIQAIDDDKLNGWIHVSDLKGWQNEVAAQYGIRSIPQTILIDPQGTIIGRNVKGLKLDKMLEEIFNKPV